MCLMLSLDARRAPVPFYPFLLFAFRLLLVAALFLLPRSGASELASLCSVARQISSRDTVLFRSVFSLLESLLWRVFSLLFLRLSASIVYTLSSISGLFSLYPSSFMSFRSQHRYVAVSSLLP